MIKKTKEELRPDGTCVVSNSKHSKADHSKHKDRMNSEGHEGHDHGDTYFISKEFTWTVNIIFTILAFFYLIVKLANPGGGWDWVLTPYIWIGVSTFIIFTNGLKYFKTYKMLFTKRVFSVNLLMAIAAHMMYIYSTTISIISLVNGDPKSEWHSLHTLWPAILLIFTLMDIGHTIEGRLNKSSQVGFDKLKELKQRNAHLCKGKKIITTEVDNIKIGDTILVREGEVIPLDGVLKSNNAIIDSANITGESKYANLTKGKYIISGSINKGKDIMMKVNHLAKDSTITRIIDKIQDSTKKLTNSQKSIDKLVKILIPTVLGLSALTFIVWIFITSFSNINSVPWSNVKGQWELPFQAIFTVLDIAAPCALGMAIPLLIAVSSYLGGNNSIIFNSSKKIDEINDVPIIAFDKTGTITEDRFAIVNVIGDKKYLPVVKALEANHNHPIARSLFEYIKEKESKVTAIKAILGKGIQGTYNGKKVIIKKSINHSQKNNSISTYVSLFVGQKEVITFEIEPKIKENAIKVIKKLKAAGKRVVMITGDNKIAAKNIAEKVGITEFYAETTPESKLEIVKKLQKTHKVMYVGDGFNDLAASRQSDVSVAFASGDEILNDLTDISLVTNDLNALLKLIKLSQLNSKATKYSVGSVFTFSFALMPLAMLLIIPPIAGVLIMIAVDILVVWNAWLYRKIGAKRLAAIG